MNDDSERTAIVSRWRGGGEQLGGEDGMTMVRMRMARRGAAARTARRSVDSGEQHGTAVANGAARWPRWHGTVVDDEEKGGRERERKREMRVRNEKIREKCKRLSP